MLSVKNLEVSYGKVQALKGVSLEVSQGQVVAVLGPNGAGKSTLVNRIMSLLGPSSGRITFMDRDISQLPTEEIVRLGITLVPEGRRLFTNLNVEENLLLGATHRYRSSAKESIEEDLEAILDKFPRLRERRNQLAGTLSGGEQQMLALARGLMAKPKLMLLDEPSIGLGPMVVEAIFAVMDGLKQEGMTLLLIEQNCDASLRIADRGYLLAAGEIVRTDPASKLLEDQSLMEMYLGRAEAQGSGMEKP